MKHAPHLLLVGLAAASVAVAGTVSGPLATGHRPELRSPIPFDHASHDLPFQERGVTCVTCHPVGARTDQGAPDQSLPVPRSTCHSCHLGEVRGAPRGAEPRCTQCHTDRSELLPADHTIDWMERHGVEARAIAAGCEACHEPRTCLQCHEQRGALSRTPHLPGFRATHGVEARVDPASCARCHVEQSCTECHSTGVIPW